MRNRHLEGASGINAMIKALLMLEHDVLLPNADFREMAANIEYYKKLFFGQGSRSDGYV